MEELDRLRVENRKLKLDCYRAQRMLMKQQRLH